MTTMTRRKHFRLMQLLPLALLSLFCAQDGGAQGANQAPPAPPPPSAPNANGAPGANFLTVPLSHPSQPAKIELHMLAGNITVHGEAANNQVVIEEMGGDLSGFGPNEEPPEARGMRRLTQSGGLSADEDNNTVTIHTGFAPENLDVRVPAKSSLMLRTLNGNIEVRVVNGELDLESMHGGITLDQVGGSVVAHALDGNVTAGMIQVDPATPSSFSSLNGRIELTLPPMLRANVNMRSDQGDIYIDQGFDFKTLASSSPDVTQALDDVVREHNARQGARAPRMTRIHMDNTIRGTLNGGGVEINIRTFNGSILVHKGMETAVPIFP